MKLIKHVKGKKDDGQCRAVTQSGNRCKRSAVHNNLCTQHFDKQNSVIKHISKYSGGALEDIPDTPPTLTGNYSDRWRQLCEHLLNIDILCGSLLRSVMKLVVAEMMIDDLSEDLRNGDTDKYLNHYVSESGHSGNQVNGIYTLMSYYEDQAKIYRKELSLDVQKLHSLMSRANKNKSKATSRSNQASNNGGFTW